MEEVRKLLQFIREKHAHRQKAKKTAIFPEVGEQTIAEDTEALTMGENPMPSLKMATTRSTSHIAKHGLKAFKQTPNMWKGRYTALWNSSNAYMAGRNRNSVKHAEPTKEPIPRHN